MNDEQSLANGAVGIALLHLETGDMPAAFAALRRATANGLSTGPGASLFYGAPALAFVLAGTDHPGLARPRAITADATATITRQRLDAAHRRIGQRQRPHYAEYDLIRGLTGLGVVLRRLGNHDVLRGVLDYLVRLTEPISNLPGWWCRNEPERTQPPGGGHANHGMAHGITGPLALLALTYRDGIIVDGHAAAITRICQWLDAWQQESSGSIWWPQTLSRTEIERGAPIQKRPSRPSWCYGAPGIARAQQLAATALSDERRRRVAESALLCCTKDVDQLASSGLCHGAAGLFQAAWRVVLDAESPELAAQLPHLEAHMSAFPPPGEVGILDGNTGQALVTQTAARGLPITGWDASLLLS
ncbi:lanthionine synthetase C family protein [Cryptosporangium sp. NPDC051539]|uniref:lanthionine synthetase C family protein n=1 Tax=Cryptosporangium sp. NPDC051539 TaxID=3363962 RepID=UPI00379DAA2F